MTGAVGLAGRTGVRIAAGLAALDRLLIAARPEGAVAEREAPAPAWVSEARVIMSAAVGRSAGAIAVHRGPAGGHATARFALDMSASTLVVHRDASGGGAATRFRILHADRRADATGSLALAIATMNDPFAALDLHHDAFEASALRLELKGLGLAPATEGRKAMVDPTGCELYEIE